MLRRGRALTNIAIYVVLTLFGCTTIPVETTFAQDKPSLTQEQLEKLEFVRRRDREQAIKGPTDVGRGPEHSERERLARKAAERARVMYDANHGCDDCGRDGYSYRAERERAAKEAARLLGEPQ